MITSTNMENNLLDVIRERKSIRSFSEQPVEEDKIRLLFEAARWAPSSMNEQPWQYIYASRDNEHLYQAIADSLMPGNRIWALSAPLLIVSLARKTFQRNGNHNGSALHDTGMANFALSLQATEMGLHTHMIGGFDHALLGKNLNLPDEVQPVVIIAVGYPGDTDQLPENLRQIEHAPRNRKSHGEFVYSSAMKN